MYLLDTCVFSEFSKKSPSSSVISWAQTISLSDIFLSSLVLGELLRGVAKLPEGFRKQELHHWVQGLFVTHQARVVSIDTTVVRVWADITSRAESMGKTPQVMDSLIGASALANDLVLVTRNVDDFQDLGVSLFNPWGAPGS